MKTFTLSIILISSLFGISEYCDESPTTTNEDKKMKLFPQIEERISSLIAEQDQIEETRKDELQELADFISEKRQNNEPVDLTFICTHNSRRSHLSQIWASTAAVYYELGGISTFSGGTEATAFNIRAVNALRKDGFKISDAQGDNPNYELQISPEGPSMVCFSKKYTDESNPQSGFIAIMTCSHADESCPIVYGAEARFPIQYIDPKVSDNTDKEDSTYFARSHQIGREMLWLMSRVK
ncbi:MAG: protein-tyrosine-phosphatase [Flavobacteriales bacterium]|nr:protein-tyrosine-phosphatase [Flavobacteriales bacterium]